ncbi:YkyA family protein [Bacillus thuringiensis]|nr:YkyA family protein [Bacillus thuringiensis]
METKEWEFYTQIIQGGKENNEGIAPKIDQAVAKINEREKVLENEKVLLGKAQEETSSIPSYINKIEDKKLQKKSKRSGGFLQKTL